LLEVLRLQCYIFARRDKIYKSLKFPRFLHFKDKKYLSVLYIAEKLPRLLAVVMTDSFGNYQNDYRSILHKSKLMFC
jgi:hypothetical protein